MDMYTVSEGSSINLECNATGVPAPDVTWSYGGSSLMSNGVDYNISRSVVQTSETFSVTSTLTVIISEREDAGVYSCNASNGVGDTVTDSTTLVVNCEFMSFVNVVVNDTLDDASGLHIH